MVHSNFCSEKLLHRLLGSIGDFFTTDDVYVFSYLNQTARTTCIFSSFSLFDTRMDDYFTHLLYLASDLGHHLIRFFEELVFSNYETFSEDPDMEASFTECYRKPKPVHCSSVIPNSSTAGSSLPQRRRRLTNQNTGFSLTRCSTIIWRNYCDFIHQGILLPLRGIRFACRLACRCGRSLQNCINHVKTSMQGVICSMRRSLQGSSEDIGWLERVEGLPPVEDGTIRFVELLHNIRHGEHQLPNTFVYLLIPGLFSNHSPLYFVNTKRFFSKMGLACHIAKIHSEASVERNAWELKQYIEELFWGSGKQVLLLGHSKGGLDAAAALSIYWDDLKDKVAGLALVQSPYGGSPIASDVLREGQVADKEARRILEFIICKLIKGDMRALEDLTYEKRKAFIAQNRLPCEQIPLVSFHTEASTHISVLATMSHIAHAELPWLPIPWFCSEADEMESVPKVPVVIPVAAAMAISALHLHLRYGEASDGLVTRRDAEVPGSVVVRATRKLDHAWMVCSSLRKDESEADASQMCEALLRLLVERGKKMKQGLVSSRNAHFKQ